MPFCATTLYISNDVWVATVNTTVVIAAIAGSFERRSGARRGAEGREAKGQRGAELHCSAVAWASQGTEALDSCMGGGGYGVDGVGWGDSGVLTAVMNLG